MRQVWKNFKTHSKENFDVKTYGAVAVFLTLCIYFNYKWDFEDSVLDSFYGSPLGYVGYAMFFMFPFLSVTIILSLYDKRVRPFSNPKYWFYLLIAGGVIGIFQGFYHADVLYVKVPRETVSFIWKSGRMLRNFVFIIIPVVLFYLFYDRKNQDSLYGLTLKGAHFKPYVVMLLIMVPLIFIASFQEDFIDYYPTYKRAKGADFAQWWGVSEWWAVVIYEFTYAMRFISIELFYRGFLIFVFVRFLGPKVMLPMAAAYCFLHFGKPMGEAISSIFGGYILGVVSLQSRNIWGGVFIHMGIALLMELVAFWQNV